LHFRGSATPLYPQFWELTSNSGWEPETFVLLDWLLDAGVTYVDCGAWIGPTVLFAAAKGAAVTAFECDPQSIRDLRKNLDLNPELARNVVLHELALSDRDQTISMYAHRPGDSMSTIRDVSADTSGLWTHAQTFSVEGVDVRRVFDSAGWLADPSALIKIDIEGGEYLVLAALRDRIQEAVCSFYVSFHPFNLVAPGRPENMVRTRETLGWMDTFWDYSWWVFAGDRFARADKNHLLAAVLAGQALPAILFSRRGVLDTVQSDEADIEAK
jgi:FkbM family methyltransferase